MARRMPAEKTLVLDSPEEQSKDINSAYASFKHNAALALLVGAPVLIAIPPRKLDLYTFTLAGAFMVSANHITRERTGRSILQQVGYQYMRTQPTVMSQKGMLEYEAGGNRAERFSESGSKLEQRAKDAWTEGQSLDWKQKRLKEEQDKLDQGEGYADMIVDQIWDVWNQKKDDNNNDEDKK